MKTRGWAEGLKASGRSGVRPWHRIPWMIMSAGDAGASAAELRPDYRFKTIDIMIGRRWDSLNRNLRAISLILPWSCSWSPAGTGSVASICSRWSLSF